MRALAQREDISYTAALRRLRGCAEDPPDTRSQTRGEAIYVRLLEAEGHR